MIKLNHLKIKLKFFTVDGPSLLFGRTNSSKSALVPNKLNVSLAICIYFSAETNDELDTDEELFDCNCWLTVFKCSTCSRKSEFDCSLLDRHSFTLFNSD
jgi:hypothetical protein